MTKLAHIHVKVDEQTKELIQKLCEEEGVDLSQCVRDLIYEALARGYIIKERKERSEKLQKIARNANT